MKYWHDLAEREKILVGIGAVVSIFLLIYSFLWLPFVNYNLRLKEELAYQRSLLTWLHSAESELNRLRSNVKRKKILATEALTMLDQTLTNTKLRSFVTEMSQMENNKIRINFNATPFDQLISWMRICWQQYAVHIEQIDIVPEDQSGLVKVYVVFRPD